MINFSQLSSAIAFGTRFICIALALYGSYLVIRQFRRSFLQPIRNWLVVSLLFIAASNVPVQFIHYNKLVGHQTSVDLSAVTAITNSLATLVATFSLVQIIKFRIKE